MLPQGPIYLSFQALVAIFAATHSCLASPDGIPSSSGEVSANTDLLTMLRNAEDRFDSTLAEQAQRIAKLDRAIGSITHNLASIETTFESRFSKLSKRKDSLSSIESLTGDMAGLKTEVLSIDQKVKALEENLEDPTLKSLTQWPGGDYALLQPRHGCPRDVTFLGRPASYLRLKTEVTANKDSHSSALSPATSAKISGLNFITLRFCEASHVTSSRSWPVGSYCINQIRGHVCPKGFKEGSAHMDADDSHVGSDYAGNVVRNHAPSQDPIIHFCCMDSGSPSTPIELPTNSEFLLYRRAGSCQAVKGMTVSEEHISIDTEDYQNTDFLAGSTPDIDLGDGAINTILYLCSYQPLAS